MFTGVGLAEKESCEGLDNETPLNFSYPYF